MRKLDFSLLRLLPCFILLFFLFDHVLPHGEQLSVSLLFALTVANVPPAVTAVPFLVVSVYPFTPFGLIARAVATALTLLYAYLFPKRQLIATVSYDFLLWLTVFLLSPFTPYHINVEEIFQRLIVCSCGTLLSLVLTVAVKAIKEKLFRFRLTPTDALAVALLWVVGGLGLYRINEAVYFSFSLLALLGAVFVTGDTLSIPFAVVCSLPACLLSTSLSPLAEFILYAVTALLFLPYSKYASAVGATAVGICFLFAKGVLNLPTPSLLFEVLALALPIVVSVCIPDKVYKKLRKKLLLYRKRTLPAVALSLSRRTVGEQLYAVSGLFREIEYVFREETETDEIGERIRDELLLSVCKKCPSRRRCEGTTIEEGLDKLIAVGKLKGKVTLVDLPAELGPVCTNLTGLLFALNQRLGDYKRSSDALDVAREGRLLLAKQAHGVSEILRSLALEQSETLSENKDELLLKALAEGGVQPLELFGYGEGDRFTVSLLLPDKTSGKTVSDVLSRALCSNFTLSEKIPVGGDKACFLFRKKANFDAVFGLSSRSKDGQTACGDTHSILKIDERRFLVALSDGMGSGNEARTVSDRTLSLLESFYKTGMPSETILSTVNHLIAYSTEETFACLDLASVNLDTGDAEIVKIGSPVSFVLDEEVCVLEGKSLPMGMLEALHPTTLQIRLKEDSFLLLMSDGITSAFGSSAELYNYLSTLHPLNPQSLSEEILKKALSFTQGRAEDDMTVLAVRMLKNG